MPNIREALFHYRHLAKERKNRAQSSSSCIHFARTYGSREPLENVRKRKDRVFSPFFRSLDFVRKSSNNMSCERHVGGYRSNRQLDDPEIYKKKRREAPAISFVEDDGTRNRGEAIIKDFLRYNFRSLSSTIVSSSETAKWCDRQ